jgi:subtilisin family serine protease
MGNPAYYLDCMQFMLAPFPLHGDPFRDGDPTRGAMVLNNSWGCPEIEGCDPNTLLPAVSALRSAGIFVEASAGNDGPACASIADPPALYAPSYTTGAIDSNGNLASFSSLGPVTIDGSRRIKPDILAPGVDVLSATPGGTYAAYPGTSMAGPHVVRVVALMWSANPALIGDIERTEAILDATAQPYQGPLPTCPEAGNRPSTASGYGILDAYSAVKMAETIK